jgi:5-methylcytosine-specific restriction enzyme subunit McrC
MRQLALTEYRLEQSVPLALHECDALRRLNTCVEIVPSIGRPGYYDLTPSSWIGAIELPNFAIQIRPKVHISRVLFLLSYAMDPRHWQENGFDFDQQDSLVEAIIPGFVFQLKRALARGILQSYRLEENALATVRGRLRLEDQINRHFGIIPPVEVTYDEFTVDIEENRLIKAALRSLERIRIRSTEMWHQLHHFQSILDSVTLVEYDRHSLPEIHYTRLNQRYRVAIELAKLILRSLSYDLNHGKARGAAFLVDMNDVFEKFVLVALREALGLSEWEFPPAGGNNSIFLDVGQKVSLRPDLSWWEDSNCRFVGDVKYKRVSATGVKHPDLYQLLAYTIATGLPGGLLIYAAGEGEPATHRVVKLAKELEVTSIDLSGSPKEILAEIARAALRVMQLRGRADSMLQVTKLSECS